MAKSNPPIPNSPSDEAGDAPSILTPWSLFQFAMRAVPSLKYALAVLGIVAGIAMIKGFGVDYRVAVFGTVIMVVLMVASVVFAALTKVRSPQVRHAALVMMWSFLLLTILTATFLFTSVFWDFPKPIEKLLRLPEHATIEPLEKPLIVIEPPAPPVKPLTEEDKAEMDRLADMLQTVAGKTDIVGDLTEAFQQYAISRAENDWNEVKRYLDNLDKENNRIKTASEAPLRRFVVTDLTLYEELIGVINEKIRMANQMRLMTFPHTSDHISLLTNTLKDLQELHKRAEKLPSAIRDYLLDNG